MSKKKLGTTKDETEWTCVVVRVELESGDVDEVDRCADEDSAEKACARLNLDQGCGPDFVHAFMTVEAFEGLEETPERDPELDDEDDDGDCGDAECPTCGPPF